MITFRPSLGIKTYYDFIDFEVLAVVINAVYATINGRQYNRTIGIHASKLDFNYYETMGNTIFIVKRNDLTFEDIVLTILHELRHWEQYQIFKLSFGEKNYDTGTYEKYRGNRLERDAERFEKIYPTVKKLYNSILRFKKKNEKEQYQICYE